MYCPNCKSEYRAGFTECADCGVPLVATLPLPAPTHQEPELDLVTIFKSADPAIMMVASSILESAKVPFTTKGEEIQDLFAWGRVPGKANIFVGPIEIQVDRKDANEAAALLKDVSVSEAEELEMEAPVTEEAAIETRPEQPADYDAIRSVHEQAFHRNQEAILVDRLREHDRLAVALVAVAAEEVVGHIAFSPITVAHAFSGFRGLGLAPVAVLPDFQNNGIGTKLIKDSLEACRTAGYDAIAVLGDPAYYSRFGFQRARKNGLANEYDADDSFMILELKPQVLERLRGLVKYSDDFAATGL